ncbi:MAG: ectoine hydroxylase [Candidatus Hydrogenedentes bacterium]|nr:ectoine hydroxylase [Candidatus Hydrogenedentota bacterium]
MAQREDTYPTRCYDRPTLLERKDPVVHGNDSGPLSRQQLTKFDEKGFLFLESFVSPEGVKVFEAELAAMQESEALRQQPYTITEPRSGDIRSVFMLHKVNDLFRDFARDERLVRIAQQLLGGDVYVHQSRINFKPGFAGKEFYWHSDFETWHAEDGLPRMRTVSFSVTLTENNPYNGSLMLIPGSHKTFVSCVGRTPKDNYKSSLKQQEYGVPDHASIEMFVERGGIEMPTGPAGSLLIFDCNVVHGSNSNISPFPRSNVFLVYNSVANAPVDPPFAADRLRPEFLGNRDTTPLEPVTFQPGMHSAVN